MSSGLRGVDHDPGEWGHSLANLNELLFVVLETAGVRSITEIGAYAGDFTLDLADFAEARGGEVLAVDPSPQPALAELADSREAVELIREPSEEALGSIRRTDAVVVDGDHNYYTVSRELGALAERFGQEGMPLLLIHDVRWPHARRDVYHAPDRIPPDERRPMASGALFPGTAELAPGGLPYRNVAARDGGPRNGVLTALEDFLSEHDELRQAIVPAFYGLGIVWPAAAPWADELERLLGPFDQNPWLGRLEQHRVYNLSRFYSESQELHESIANLQAANQRKAEWLQLLANSRSFRLAERLASLRGGVPWRRQLKALIDEG